MLVLIGLVVVVTNADKLVDSVHRLCASVTYCAERAFRPSITNVLVQAKQSAIPARSSTDSVAIREPTGATAGDTVQYVINVFNPGDRLSVVNYVRVTESSTQSRPDSLMVLVTCGGDLVFFLAGRLRIRPGHDTTMITGRVGSTGEDMRGYFVDAHGLVYETCADGDREFRIEFRAAVKIPSHDQTQIFVRVPQHLRIDPDSFEVRKGRSVAASSRLPRDYLTVLSPRQVDPPGGHARAADAVRRRSTWNCIWRQARIQNF